MLNIACINEDGSVRRMLSMNVDTYMEIYHWLEYYRSTYHKSFYIVRVCDADEPTVYSAVH